MKKRVLSLLLCTAMTIGTHYPVVEKKQEMTKERLQKYLEMMQRVK